MRAILYAAGVGSRLGAITRERPKILLEFAGRTLLDRHVQNLLAVGVSDLVVVVGYERDRVEAEIERLSRERRVEIAAARNDAFLEGSALSVAAAADRMTVEAAPFLLMDGDVLYSRSVLRRLVESPHPTCLLTDSRCAIDEEDPVLVPMRAGRPIDFCKRYRGPYEEIGESVGFFKLGAGDLERWLEATRARTIPGRRGETLEDIVQELVREGRFGSADVTGLPWIEIDYPEDVLRAETEILAAIARE